MSEFIVEIKDDETRRVIIPRDVWNLLGIKKGDFYKFTLEKVERPNDSEIEKEE